MSYALSIWHVYNFALPEVIWGDGKALITALPEKFTYTNLFMVLILKSKFQVYLTGREKFLYLI